LKSSSIRLVLADVDGTLVTNDKVLTDRAVAAVRKLGEAGILFAVTSGRPPKGMSMLIEPLDITTPIAAFNGGLLVDRDMSVIEQRVLPEELVRPVADLDGLTRPTRMRTRARSPAICPRSTRSHRRPSPRSATCRTTC